MSSLISLLADLESAHADAVDLEETGRARKLATQIRKLRKRLAESQAATVKAEVSP